MSRTLPLLLALLLLTAAAPAADAARRSGVDIPAHVRLTLDGRELTANDYAPPGAGWFSFEPDDEMWQRPERLQAVCGTTFRAFRRSQRDRYVLAHGSWPRERRRATFRFRRDLSARVRWCLIGGVDGGETAFVSFVRGEPRRRVAGGRGADGRAWALAAWRGNRLDPCLRLRAHGTWQGRCFDDQAEGPAQLDFELWNASCTVGSFIYGVAPMATETIDLTYADGRRQQFAALSPAAGSRLRARLFVTELMSRDPVVLTALDAAGRALQTTRTPARICA